MTELEREKGNSCGKGEGNEMAVWRRRRKRGERDQQREGVRDREDGAWGKRGTGNRGEGRGGPRRCLLNY